MSSKRRTSIFRKNVISEDGHPKTVFEMECISAPKEIRKVEEFLNRVNSTARLDDKMSRQFVWLVGMLVTVLAAVVGGLLSR